MTRHPIEDIVNSVATELSGQIKVLKMRVDALEHSVSESLAMLDKQERKVKRLIAANPKADEKDTKGKRK
jgi:hypothetical protein